MKKIDIISWLILVTIIGSTSLIDYRIKQIRYDIENSQIPKLSVIDNSQLNRLCANLVSQWGGQSHALYILQPNSNIKTHKELVNKSVPADIPIRLDISDYSKLEKHKNYYTGSDFNIFTDYGLKGIPIDYVLIPIYKNSIIVAEFIIFYEQNSIPKNLDSEASEAQIISSLLQ